MPEFSELAFYLDILKGALAAGLAFLVYFFFRLVIRKFPGSKEKVSGFVLSKLVFPGSFLLAILILRTPIARNVLAFGTGPNRFLKACFVFFLALFFIRLIDACVQGRFLRKRVPFPLPRVLHALILVVLYVLILFMILKGILGINITPFLATSAILTGILGLALQGVLSNILSGMSLHLTKSFGRGDWVRIRDTEGVVMDTNWRETRIFDRSFNVVVIPNNIVAAEIITNFSSPDNKSAVALPVKAGYESPPALVLKLLREAAREVQGVLTAPAPASYIMSYDELGISYLLKFWISDYSRKQATATEAGRHVWYKFKRENISIPVPVVDQVDHFVSALAEKGEAAGPAAGDEEIFRALAQSAFLRRQEGERAGELIVPEEELRAFSAWLRRKRFTAGEILFSQGEKGVNCYILVKGKVKGRIVYAEEDKEYASEFSIGPGGLVGEMSLFTGMPRTATIVVGEESELLEIDAQALAELLSRNPDLSEAIAEIVSARNMQNQERLRKIKELSAEALEESSDKTTVLEYLKKLVRFFKRS